MKGQVAREAPATSHSRASECRASEAIEWHRAGSCRAAGGADFYPPMHVEAKPERLARERRAKSVCAGCPVRVRCLEHAIAVDERYGIWGGLNQDERRLLRESA